MEEFLKKLEAALKELVTLEITTVVGNIGYPVNPVAPIPDAKVIHTRIDLVQGDISTEMSPEFVTGTLTGLRDYHLKREEQAAAIIKANVEMLEKLFHLVIDVRRQSAAAPPGPAT